MLSPPCCIYRVRYGIHFLIVRLTFVLFQMSQLRAAKRVCKNPGTKAYYLTKSCNDVARRDWLYRDGAARKVLGDRDFVFGDELTRDCRLCLILLSVRSKSHLRGQRFLSKPLLLATLITKHEITIAQHLPGGTIPVQPLPSRNIVA